MPVPGDSDVTVSYDFLLQLEEEGEEWYRPEGSRERVRVSDMLDGVESSDRRIQRRQVKVADLREQTMAKLHAFLSYCHDDSRKVAQLREDLIAAGQEI